MTAFEADGDLPAVAIIGMSVRIPGADTPDRFWRMLLEGKEALSTFDDEQLRRAGVDEALIGNPAYVKIGAVLEHARTFDAVFFGFTPLDADILDPQRRMLLECGYEALEDAGYAPGRHAGLRVGVYAGVGVSHYFFRNLALNAALGASVGFDKLVRSNDRDFAATEMSYKLDLTGPSLTVSTACSTSLLCVHLACKSLLNYECDLALAGGAAIHSVAEEGYLYEEGNIFSPDGHCRAFDAEAKGTVAGSGAGIVVLKRLDEALADGDAIVAIIRGSAANNDGAGKIGYTAPSAAGQAQVIAEALAVSQTPAQTITYIEAHGTGTVLGDPIELRALDQVFRGTSADNGSCAIGSLKSNIGHSGTAAGVLGLIKAALACREGKLPASLHYLTQNPMFPVENSPFRVNDSLRDWLPENGLRRAGVSAFGIGGTNVHVVLEQPPPRPQSDTAPRMRIWPLSARTESAARAQVERLDAWLAATPASDLARAAFTLQQGREHHDHRIAVVAADRGALSDALSLSATLPVTKARERPSVAFLFPGQGAQHLDMARDVYTHEAVFREHFDACAQHLRTMAGFDLRDLIHPQIHDEPQREAARVQLAQTRYTQPALFVVEYALAQLWMHWGLRPRIMIGHSLGEYVCACIAGTLSCEDALRLVVARARLMQALPPGAMIAATISIDDAGGWLGDGLWLAAHNARNQVVYAGTPASIDGLARAMAAAGVQTRRLQTSQAFHSGLVDAALADFEVEVRRVALHAPALPWVSNLSGRDITAAEAVDPMYWVRHMREPVNFCAGLDALCAEHDDLLLEVGPGQTLSALAKRHLPERAADIISSQLRVSAQGEDGHRALLMAAARMWERNAPVDFSRIEDSAPPGRLSLPTYPWQRRPHWIEPSAAVVALMRALGGSGEVPVALQTMSQADGHPPHTPAMSSAVSASEAIVLDVMRELFGMPQIGVHDDFFEIGGDSLLATRCVSRLNAQLRICISLKAFMERPTAAALAAYADALALAGGVSRSTATRDIAVDREVGVL